MVVVWATTINLILLMSVKKPVSSHTIQACIGEFCALYMESLYRVRFVMKL